MGLDVYLYHCPDRPTAKAREEECEKRQDAEWAKVGSYDSLTDEQKEEIRQRNAAIAVELDCTGEYESHNTVTKIEKDSAIAPDHMFKIGYLRSSYNEGGINRVLDTLGIPTLYDIFAPNDRYEFTPDWKKSLDLCTTAIDTYSAHLASAVGDIAITKVSANMFTNPDELPKDENAVLEIVKRELAEWAKRDKNHPFADSGFSNKEGEFFLSKPMQVVAIIPGTQGSLAAKLYQGREALEMCTYIAYRIRKDEEDEGKENWYLTALKITREMIEYVLAQPDPEHYYLHWSS